MKKLKFKFLRNSENTALHSIWENTNMHKYNKIIKSIGQNKHCIIWILVNGHPIFPKKIIQRAKTKIRVIEISSKNDIILTFKNRINKILNH